MYAWAVDARPHIFPSVETRKCHVGAEPTNPAAFYGHFAPSHLRATLADGCTVERSRSKSESLRRFCWTISHLRRRIGRFGSSSPPRETQRRQARSYTASVTTFRANINWRDGASAR